MLKGSSSYPERLTDVGHSPDKEDKDKYPLIAYVALALLTLQNTGAILIMRYTRCPS